MTVNIIESLIAEEGDFSVNDFAIYRHTAYVESSNVGLASTANADFSDIKIDLEEISTSTTGKLASLLRSNKIIEAAIGLAAINSSLDIEKIKDKLVQKNAVHILREKGAGKNVSIIGHFPFIESFRADGVCENIRVFEMNPKNSDDLSPDLMRKYLPRSDVVMISGSTLINHSFDRIISLCDKSYNIILGPSTPLTPLLFEFKIDAICGTIVRDKEAAKSSFARGTSYRKAEGLEFVSLAK